MNYDYYVDILLNLVVVYSLRHTCCMTNCVIMDFLTPMKFPQLRLGNALCPLTRLAHRLFRDGFIQVLLFYQGRHGGQGDMGHGAFPSGVELSLLGGGGCIAVVLGAGHHPQREEEPCGVAWASRTAGNGDQSIQGKLR